MATYVLGMALMLGSWIVALNARSLSESAAKRLPLRIRGSMPRRSDSVPFFFLRVPFHVVLDLPLYILSMLLAFGGVAVLVLASVTWYELTVYGYGFKSVSLLAAAIAFGSIWLWFRLRSRFATFRYVAPWATKDASGSKRSHNHALQRARRSAPGAGDDRARR
jgi:hypothetical protein